MINITYRKATAKDAEAVSLLWAEYFDFHHNLDKAYKRKKSSEKDIANYLVKTVKQSDNFIYVAEDKKKLVGFIWAEILSKPPHFELRSFGQVSDIAVTQSYRHRGIAQQLLRKAMEWFRTKKIKHVEARVLLANPLSSGFWTNTGFEPFVQIVRQKINH
jgi:ribosomal protein S18 acetylase RimI-like enzyme